MYSMINLVLTILLGLIALLYIVKDYNNKRKMTILIYGLRDIMDLCSKNTNINAFFLIVQIGAINKKIIKELKK